MGLIEQLVVSCLGIFLNATGFIFFESRAYEYKHKKATVFIASVIFVVIAITSCVTINSFWFMLICAGILYFAYALLIFNARVKKVCVDVLVYVAISVICIVLLYAFFRYVSEININQINMYYGIYIVFVMYIMQMCLMMIYRGVEMKKTKNIFVIVYAFIQTQYIPLGIGISIKNSNPVYAIFFTGVGVMSLVLVYFLSKYMMKQIRLERASKFLDEQLTLQQRHVEEMNIQYDNVSSFKAGFVSEINKIREINQRKDKSEIKESINNLEKHINSLSSIKFTGNPAIDSIIYFKLNTAKEYNINVNMNIGKYSGTGIQEIDICSVIANLLDNAIEACLREKGKRYIDFSMKMLRGFLVIGVKNPCSDYSPKTKKKRPEEHGIGTLIVRDIADNYGGSVETVYNQEEFSAVVTLPEGA